jgi:phosphatidate cytidylyltransferase
MLESKGLRVFKFYGATMSVLYVSVVFLVSYFPCLNHGLEHIALFIIVLGLFVLQTFERDPHRALGNISGVLSGFVYVPWLWSFIFKVIYYPGVDGRWFVFALFLIVKGGDMLAYVVGSSIGKHKLIPRISPGKTWEGAVGNLAGGLIAGLIIWAWFPCGFSLKGALVLAVLLNVLGQVGDLAESMLKRDADLKDSSGFIPGMGGALDVLDSLLLTFPVLYFYLLLYQ